MPPARSILHLDMDAFFASIEQLDHPELKGKPILVGYDGPRGVVATASYEARPFGCHSAQPMAVAKRLCPQAIIIPVRHERYREISQQMFAILEAFSPRIEPLSIDEAFLDLTGTDHLLGPAKSAARQMKARIKSEIGLTASVGVAPNKFLAKLASDLHKPDGLTIIRQEDVDILLPPMPVTRIWGIGPAMAGRLKLLSINTVGDLRKFPLDVLREQIGDEADRYYRLAYGLDDRPVESDQEAKSIGQEQTFQADVGNPEAVHRVLLEQVEQVARRLRKHGLLARSVTLKIRFGDFQTITRSSTLHTATNTTVELENAAMAIFDRWAGKSFQPVRLIGVTAAQFGAGERQMNLFADPEHEKQKRVDAVADAISRRFGDSAIKRGGTLRRKDREPGQ
jgi:DNA polymerase IV